MNPLDQLQDITVPTEVSIWPLAIGWWVVICLVVISLILVIIYSLKYQHKHRLRKLALNELRQLNKTDTALTSDYNSLLKRVVKTYRPTLNMARLHGNEWAKFLSVTLKSSKSSKKYTQQFTQMAMAIYDGSTNDSTNNKSARQCTEYWLKHVSLKALETTPLEGVKHV